MSFNPVIRGLNASWTFITRGFSARLGFVAPICRTWTSEYVCIKSKTNDFIKLKVYTR